MEQTKETKEGEKAAEDEESKGRIKGSGRERVRKGLPARRMFEI
jgi:hypothetical protein